MRFKRPHMSLLENNVQVVNSPEAGRRVQDHRYYVSLLFLTLSEVCVEANTRVHLFEGRRCHRWPGAGPLLSALNPSACVDVIWLLCKSDALEEDQTGSFAPNPPPRPAPVFTLYLARSL
ncbi:hypothetical protein SKAU_G00336060 [Synaphobranchus kaupii]|uniref:Uncharacterized protein n=1 Tax=Synaphobranchus kaupii TaxID=118154 RepID=A0A9Q1EM10_SYNKA|nr:hypothetical protein SKAU_G00336060 [Synaphobranchus kaupii]